MNRVKLCKSCQTAIVYASQVGHDWKSTQPIDATPADDGNIRLYDDARYAIVPASALPAYREAGIPLHRSHFSSCPNAAAHRRRKARV